MQEHYVSEAKREDRYEPPGIITPSGAIKYRKHEVSVNATPPCWPIA